jgi:hypothetical protein
MSSSSPAVSPSFASLLKSALPGYIVIDMSAVKGEAFIRAFLALRNKEKVVAVVVNLPSNQELVKQLMAGLLEKEPAPFRCLVSFAKKMMYQPISNETETSLVNIVKRWVIGFRTDCYICYEAIKGDFISCETCGASPCRSCSLRMFDSGDHKCANCRSPFEGADAVLERMR